MFWGGVLRLRDSRTHALHSLTDSESVSRRARWLIFKVVKNEARRARTTINLPKIAHYFSVDWLAEWAEPEILRAHKSAAEKLQPPQPRAFFQSSENTKIFFFGAGRRKRRRGRIRGSAAEIYDSGICWATICICYQRKEIELEQKGRAPIEWRHSFSFSSTPSSARPLTFCSIHFCFWRTPNAFSSLWPTIRVNHGKFP